MIRIKTITYENIGDFDDTSYGAMPLEQRKSMIEEVLTGFTEEHILSCFPFTTMTKLLAL